MPENTTHYSQSRSSLGDNVESSAAEHQETTDFLANQSSISNVQLRLWRWVRVLAVNTVPTFLRYKFENSHTQREVLQESQSDIRTSHLSGLRGVASLVVFIYHYCYGSYPGVNHVFGDGEDNRSILQLPFFRLMFAAEAMVALFLLLSGFVLSHRCVKHLVAGSVDEFYASVSSLAFRRGIRLFLPAVTASALAYLAHILGLMPTKGLPKDYSPSFLNGTQLYIRYLKSLLDPWKWKLELDYAWFNPHLWTVPVEFRCSMVLFVSMTATAQCAPRIRIIMDGVIVALSMLACRWDVALFLAGKALAEIECRRTQKELRERKLTETGSAGINLTPFHGHKFAWCVKVGRYCVLLTSLFFGMYLASYPASPPEHAPTYGFLSSLVHNDPMGRRVYYAAAAILLLFPSFHLAFLRRPFECAIARYFGRISYALYLTHGTVLRMIGGRVLQIGWKLTGINTWWAFNAGFGLATIFVVPVVIWVADLFEEWVDSKSIALAKWCEELLFFDGKENALESANLAYSRDAHA